MHCDHRRSMELAQTPAKWSHKGDKFIFLTYSKLAMADRANSTQHSVTGCLQGRALGD